MCLLWGIRQQGELPFISKEQKQSAATAGSCIPGLPFHSSYHCHFIQTSQQKQTSRDISCIFTQTNSPEALKASHVWPIKHTRGFGFFFFRTSTKKSRDTGDDEPREENTHTALHTLTVFITILSRNPCTHVGSLTELYRIIVWVCWLALLVNSLFLWQI